MTHNFLVFFFFPLIGEQSHCKVTLMNSAHKKCMSHAAAHWVWIMNGILDNKKENIEHFVS